MSYQKDLWKEMKAEYLKQVEEALNAIGQTDISEMLEDLDAHLEQKYRDLTLEEKSLERYEKIIAQMGPASDYVELLKSNGNQIPGKKQIIKEAASPKRSDESTEKTVIKPVIIPIESYDDTGALSKMKWLLFGILAAAVIAFFVWKTPNNTPAKIETRQTIQAPAAQPIKQVAENSQISKNPDLEYQTYIVKFTTATEVNNISARELFAMFSAKEPAQVKTNHFKTEVRDNRLIGWICVDNKADLDATTAMLLSSNDLKLVSVEPGTEDNLRNLNAMGQPSLDLKRVVPPAAVIPASAPPDQNKNSAAAIPLAPGAIENTNKAKAVQRIYPKRSGPAVIFISKPGVEDIVIGKSNMRTVKSIFGAPMRIDMNGRMLRYTDDGIDLLFSAGGPLNEIHLNQGFTGRLDTGISMDSTRQDVFTAYGEPVNTIKTAYLRRRNDERILWTKDSTSRIYYGKCGLIFWFDNDSVSQIIVFKGQMTNEGGRTPLPEMGNEIQSWTQNGRIIDKTDYPFISDTDVVGHWTSVDYVKNIEDFNPGQNVFQGKLFLAGMVLNSNGTTSGSWRWTKGIIMDPVDRTASRYFIKDFDGTKYMFFEWKSADYFLRHQKPWYYVLKKID